MYSSLVFNMCRVTQPSPQLLLEHFITPKETLYLGAVTTAYPMPHFIDFPVFVLTWFLIVFMCEHVYFMEKRKDQFVGPLNSVPGLGWGVPTWARFPLILRTQSKASSSDCTFWQRRLRKGVHPCKATHLGALPYSSHLTVGFWNSLCHHPKVPVYFTKCPWERGSKLCSVTTGIFIIKHRMIGNSLQSSIWVWQEQPSQLQLGWCL